MQDLLSILSAEVTTYLAAPDKREYLITRAETLFDELVVPIDLPGPDVVVDPVLRAAIRTRPGSLPPSITTRLTCSAATAPGRRS